MPGLIDFFPHVAAVTYAKAPLEEVVCQVRFPTILRIDSELPSAFQDQVREAFPLFERVQLLPEGMTPPQLPPEVAQLFGAGQPTGQYAFSTEDRSSSLTLTSQSFALMTKKYRRWDDFSALLRQPLALLLNIYKPAFFTRIGLRYKNVIDRDRLGARNESWSTLFRREIAAELSIPEMASNAQDVRRMLRLKLTDAGEAMLLQHGLITVPGRNDPCYILDCDFYTNERTEVNRANDALAKFNDTAWRTFRWTISDRLHHLLEPAEVAAQARANV